jgi:hypothetical protein
MLRKISYITAILLGVAFTGVIWAANPLLSLEGTFSDSSRGLIQGSKQVTIKLSSGADLVNSSEGTVLWQETLPSVFFVDGFMAVDLGQSTLFKKEYFLQPDLSFILQIDGVTGKVSIPIRQVPFAFQSQIALEALKVSANNVVGSFGSDRLSGSYTSITGLGTLTSTLNISAGLIVNSSLVYVNAGKNRVGIGTSSPLQKLDVNGGIRVGTTTSNVQGSIRFDSSHFQGYNGTDWVNLDLQSSEVGSWSSGTGKVILYDGTNKVGIGVTSPQERLHVGGNIFTTGNMRVSGNALISGQVKVGPLFTALGKLATQNTVSLTADVTGVLPVANGGTGGTSFTSSSFIKGSGTSPLSSSSILFESGSKIGIGTSTPTQMLDIVGTVNVSQGFTVNGIPVGGTAGGWSSGSGKVVLLDTTNKVGMGVTSPQERLHIGGNLFVTGDIRASGNVLISGLVKVGPLLTVLGKLATQNTVALATDAVGVLPIAKGGTGATTTASIRIALGTVLGLAKLATQNTVALTTDVTGTLPVANGGTGATTASAARTALGLVISTDVQAQDTELSAVAGLTSAANKLPYFTGSGTAALTDLSSNGRSFIAQTSTADMRSVLGVTVGGGAASGANSDITSLSGLTTPLSVTQGGTGAATASGARTALGLVISTDVQAQDAELSALAGLTSAANKLPYFTGSGTASLTDLSSNGRSLMAQTSSANMRSVLGVVIGTDTQAQDTELSALAGLTSAANKIPYFTGSGTAALTDLSSNGRSFIAQTSSANMRSVLSLTVGTDVQAQDAELSALAGLTSAANKLAYFTGSGTAALADLSSNGRSLIAQTSSANMRSVLGVGTGLAASGANSDITSLSALSTPLSVAQGGTGASTLTSSAFVKGNGTSALSSSAILFEASSKIGIGTSTPGQVLDVVGTVNVTKAFTVNGVPVGTSSGASWSGATNLYTLAKVGIGISNPSPALHVATQNGVVFSGVFGSGSIPVDSTSASETLAGGVYTRLMWYPKKASFRVGALTNSNKTFWDDTHIGNYSLAFGHDSRATADYSVVAGGSGNIAGGQRSFVGSGVTNYVYSNDSSIVGGNNNKVYPSTTYSFIGGGGSNQISGLSSYSVISGGNSNSIVGSPKGTIAGGGSNTLLSDSDFSIIAGGFSNTIDGASYAFAAGRRAKVNDSGSFLWADSTDADISTTAANQFIVRASGGIWLGSNSSVETLNWGTRLLQTSTGAYLTTAGDWISVSDKNKKENFTDIDLNELLNKIDTMPVQQWNYKINSPDVKHIGPVAQDFYAAFKLGDTDVAISAVDEAGVALAAIKALSKKLKEKEAKISDLEKRIEALEALIH